jgi:hypothetical protein
MKITVTLMLLGYLISRSLNCWAEHAVLALSTQQPSEGEFIQALQTIPETSWSDAALTYPNGLAGASPLYHAVAFGMTNAVELLIQSPSRYVLKSGSSFDPIGAAIALKRWDILDRLLSSDMGQKIDDCSCCDYIGLLTLSADQATTEKYLERLARGCGACTQNERGDNVLLSAIASTNGSLSKWLMRAGAHPQYSFGKPRVVAMGNATLENQLMGELESTARVYLSSSGAIIKNGEVELALESEALSNHDWVKTLVSAATQSGFRAVLIELMDVEGARIFNSVVHPAAVEAGVNVFLRDHAVSRQ